MWMTGDCRDRRDGLDGTVVLFLSLKGCRLFVRPGEAFALQNVNLAVALDLKRLQHKMSSRTLHKPLCASSFHVSTPLENRDVREGVGLPHCYL